MLAVLVTINSPGTHPWDVCAILILTKYIILTTTPENVSDHPVDRMGRMRPGQYCGATGADHESRRTIKLDDRTNDAISLDGIKRMLILPMVSALVSTPEGLMFGVESVAGPW
jgi:hypothetical protein